MGLQLEEHGILRVDFASTRLVLWCRSGTKHRIRIRIHLGVAPEPHLYEVLKR